MQLQTITDKLHKEAEAEVREQVRASLPKFPAYPAPGYTEHELWITFDGPSGTKVNLRMCEVLSKVEETLVNARLPAAKEAKVTEFMNLVRSATGRMAELEARI